MTSPTMRVFTYLDNRLPLYRLADAPVLIEIEAETITEADRIVDHELGLAVAKSPAIGCRVSAEFSFEPLDLHDTTPEHQKTA
jgi:hypothetical protein